MPDRRVTQEERFEEMERRQAEQAYERQQKEGGDGTEQAQAEYCGAFVEYLLKGENGVSVENRKLFESRAGLSGLAGGVLVPAISSARFRSWMPRK